MYRSGEGQKAPACTGAVLYGCYSFGITLEKVDLDLRGAHHGIRSSRTLGSAPLDAVPLLRRSPLDLSCLGELSLQRMSLTQLTERARVPRPQVFRGFQGLLAPLAPPRVVREVGRACRRALRMPNDLVWLVSRPVFCLAAPTDFRCNRRQARRSGLSRLFLLISTAPAQIVWSVT